MKKSSLVFLIMIIFLNILYADSLSNRTMGNYNSVRSGFEKHGLMLSYGPTDKGISAKVYGLPNSREFKATLSYFSFYVERKGKFSGGEFDDPPLDFWEKEDKDIYRKYIVNLGVTQGLTAKGGIFLAYYAGLGLSEEFHQYKSSYGNYWFKNENKMIGDIGIELNGRLSVINFGIGFSYQSLYYLSAGFEF